MRLVFRDLPVQRPDFPSPGELRIEPAENAGQRPRALAELVLQAGPAALPGDRAEGVKCVVLPADPTLDDMLAAMLVERMLTGKSVPEGMALFARYAALVREGFSLGKVPLIASLEATYKAIRVTAGKDLTEAETGQRFLLGWSRLAAAILRAAEAGKDPSTDSFLKDDLNFARERAFLERDEEIYRQDVSRGEKWIVSLPDGPPTASGLILRKPRSILWKFWSRCDQESPTGEPYLFLGVDWGQGNWAFSTDPVHRLPLKPLAEELKSAEKKIDPNGTAKETWFEGKPFDYTLIAAPRAGSRLTEEELIGIVKRWTQARVATCSTRLWWPRTAIAASTILVIVLIYTLADHLRADKSSIDRPTLQSAEQTSKLEANSRGLKTIDPKPQSVRNGRYLIASVGINKYVHWDPLHNAVPDAMAITQLFAKQFDFEVLKPLYDDAATKKAIELLVKDYLRTLLRPEDKLLFYFAGHGKTRNDRVGGKTVETGFLVPVEAQKDCWSDLLELKSLLEELAKLPAAHVLVILDSCHSGIALGECVPRYRGHDHYEPDMENRISRKVITSARGDQLATDGSPANGHSLFADTLLEGLGNRQADTNNDKIITSRELGLYLQQAVGEASGSRQTPDFGEFSLDDRGEMIIPIR